MSPTPKKARPHAKPTAKQAVSADALPHLAAFLSGYLHEDFALEYDSPAAALAGFLSECNAAERRGLSKDWRAFSAAMKDQPWPTVRAALTTVGGAWRPPSRAALDSVFSSILPRS